MKVLNGYRASHRNKWQLIRHGILGLQELSLLEYYADIFDFDKNHTGFGTFEVYFIEIAPIFGKSENTIRNWHNKLLLIGFIEKTARAHIYKLKIPARYITPGLWKGEAAYYAELEKGQSIETILLNFGINLSSVGKKVQSVVNNNAHVALRMPSIALGSSKDGSRDKTQARGIGRQEERSKQEYEQILQEGPYLGMTTDDLKWIDENVSGGGSEVQTKPPISDLKKKNNQQVKSFDKPQLTLVPYFQLTPIERYYAALGDKFPNPNSYIIWKERKQKSGQWKN